MRTEAVDYVRQLRKCRVCMNVLAVIFVILLIRFITLAGHAADAPVMTVTHPANSNTFSVSFAKDSAIPDGAVIICAAYSASGQMLDVRLQPYTSGAAHTFMFYNGETITVKAFLVSKEYAPLCTPAEITDFDLPLQTETKPEIVDTGTGNVLVAYFSFTGSTRQAAEYIAEESGADLYEIFPMIPYESNNSTYYDQTTRAYQEQYDGDNSTRPEIATIIKDISSYDTVFLGFPTWYGQAPRIINTFLESYDFSDKTIIPFHTCSSSSVSNLDKVRASAPGAVFRDIKKFTSSSMTERNVKEWVDELGYKQASSQKRIRVSANGYEVLFALNGTLTATSLYEQLPMSIVVSNYSDNEKIFYPPKKLDCSDGIESACPAGTLAYFSPWGNIVMYYGPAPKYTGLYVLGEAIEGADNISQLSGTLEITAER